MADDIQRGADARNRSNQRKVRDTAKKDTDKGAAELRALLEGPDKALYDVNFQSDGETPLFRASALCTPILLEKGCDPHTPNDVSAPRPQATSHSDDCKDFLFKRM